MVSQYGMEDKMPDDEKSGNPANALDAFARFGFRYLFAFGINNRNFLDKEISDSGKTFLE